MNTNYPVQAKHSLAINAPVEDVWAIIVGVSLWPQLFSHVQSTKIKDDFAVGNSFSWKSGGINIVSTIQDLKPHSLIRWIGKAIGTSAVHTWELRSHGDHTFLEMSESFDGWLVWLMPKVFQKNLDKTLIQWLLDIKRAAEK